MSDPRLRPIGTLHVSNAGSMPMREVKHRSIDDGQAARVHGVAYADGEVVTNHKRRHRYIDVVLPSAGTEHATGLILRFTTPEDIETLQAVLDDALELAREKRPDTRPPAVILPPSQPTNFLSAAVPS